jgi:murein L,D-transpeptidase YafK
MRLISGVLLALILALAPSAHAGEKADRVLVEKSERLLHLYKAGKLLASYRIALGGEPVGAKQQQGDNKTPEGHYILDFKKPDSAYYKAIHVSYPNAKDRDNAGKLGVSPGGDIMIHGQPNGYGWAAGMTQRFDWTLGCIALTDEDMEAVWQAVDVGTPIQIKP